MAIAIARLSLLTIAQQVQHTLLPLSRKGPIQGVPKMQTAQWSGNARIPSRPGGPELTEGQSVNHSTHTK